MDYVFRSLSTAYQVNAAWGAAPEGRAKGRPSMAGIDAAMPKPCLERLSNLTTVVHHATHAAGAAGWSTFPGRLPRRTTQAQPR